jgi:hypothetical protein
MKWHLHAVVAGGKYLGEVEADTEQEAIDKGWELDSAGVDLCHQCSSECEDGEIQSIAAEPVTRGDS